MAFSLLDEPWLPLVTTDGSHQQGSLREALLEPSRWGGLDSAHPLQCLALYRLLLAISHRAIGPADTSDDRAELLDSWPADQVEAYLTKWVDRFELFGGDRPFMQHPGVAAVLQPETPCTVMAPELSSGSNATLWDRSLDAAPPLFDSAELARMLVAQQQFSPCGLVRKIRTSGSRGFGSKLQLLLPLGPTLQATLAMNLLPQAVGDYQLDPPCWEAELPTIKQLEQGIKFTPAGPGQRYTAQVRAVLLVEASSHCYYGAGFATPDALPVVDPMAAVVQGSKGPMPLMLYEGRTLWRDATALLGGAGSVPPAVLKHAAELMMAAEDYEPIELLAGGILPDTSNQAKTVLWRLEQRHLAPGLVGNAEAQAVVEALLEQTTAKSKALYGAISTLCRGWLDQGSEVSVDEKAVTAFRKGLQHDALFWGSLETEFWGAIHSLGDGATGEAVLDGWRQTLRLTVRMVWDHCCTQIGNDGRGLRAQGLAGHAIGKVLAGLAESVETSAALGA